MDARAVPGGFHGGSGGVDVFVRATRQTGDDRAADLGGDLLDGMEIAVADDRETGLDDIDVEAAQLAGHLHFFAQVHGCAGALFAVAQGSVEDDDFVGHGIRKLEENGVVRTWQGSRKVCFRGRPAGEKAGTGEKRLAGSQP